MSTPEPLTPEEEKALREAWISIGGWELTDRIEGAEEVTCPVCNGEGACEGFRLDATNVTPATLGGYGIGKGLDDAELVANSTGALLATLDQTRAELDALALIAGQAMGLRNVDFRAGERVNVPPAVAQHALFGAMCSTVVERDAALERAERAERDLKVEREAALLLAAELAAAKDALGEAWLVGGASLAEEIRRKTARLEQLATATMAFDLIAHLHRQRIFSEKTFGPSPRTKGVLAHIRKELGEVEKKPTDLEEWIDVVLLAFDGAWRHGHEPEAIAQALAAKQAKNESRTWPDWRTAPADQAIEHERSEAPEPADVFFGAPDDEAFQAKTPEEYLLDLGRRDGDVVVAEFRRKVVDPEHLKRGAGVAFDAFLQHFDDEYSGEDGSGMELAEEQFIETTTSLLVELAKEHARPYICEEHSRRIYTAAEIAAIFDGDDEPEPTPAPAAVEVVKFEKRGGGQ